MLGKRNEKSVKVPKDDHDETWHAKNKQLLDQDEAEIQYLEKMLGIKNDSKKK